MPNSLFTDLGPAYFSPSCPAGDVFHWNTHGGINLTTRVGDHPLMAALSLPVTFFFMEPSDPLIPHFLLCRPIILFDSKWVCACVKAGRLVEMGDWVIDPQFTVRPFLTRPSSTRDLTSYPRKTEESKGRESLELVEGFLDLEESEECQVEDLLFIGGDRSNYRGVTDIDDLNEKQVEADRQDTISNQHAQSAFIKDMTLPEHHYAGLLSMDDVRNASIDCQKLGTPFQQDIKTRSIQPETQFIPSYDLQDVLTLLRHTNRHKNVQEEIIINNNGRWRVSRSGINSPCANQNQISDSSANPPPNIPSSTANRKVLACGKKKRSERDDKELITGRGEVGIRKSARLVGQKRPRAGRCVASGCHE